MVKVEINLTHVLSPSLYSVSPDTNLGHDFITLSKFIRDIPSTLYPIALIRVTGRFGQDPFRPQFLAETSLISWTFRPQNVNDSANKYERFGQINYIAADIMSLQNGHLSSAIMLAAAIVTNVLLTICDVILSICDVIVLSLSWVFSASVSGYHSLHFCQTYLSIYLS